MRNEKELQREETPPLPQDLLERIQSRALPASSPAALASCVFDLRRGLMTSLTDVLAQGNATYEDTLRDTLPQLDVPPGPFVPVFSPWRAAVIAVLGLLLGSALGQAVNAGGIWAVLGGTAGVGLTLWAAECLARIAARGHLPGGLAWSKARRRVRLGLLVLLGLAVLRDFLQGNPTPQSLLAAVGAFLSQGSVLPLFTNLYGALALAALFLLLAERPVRLDVEEYKLRLALAARVWWDGAVRYAAALAARHDGGDRENRRRLRQAGQDLYSFACELPPARRAWLEDRLRQLGLEAPRPQGELSWNEELAQTHDPVGYLEPGDRCYVDLPPLLENGTLLRKGTVRKVRS